ncbi:MAG: hypothetical protein FWH27_02760 [Planctomycetaceae bacterium]|nr:hypothetical protein [Planctomycetaceae bacterium]
MRNSLIIFCLILLTVLPHAVALGQTEAVLGQPFGVGCIVLPILPNELSASRGLEEIQIYEQNNRVLYPIFEVREVPREVTQAFQNARRPIGRLVGEILDQTGTSIAVYFLFTGNQAPLNVTIVTNRSVTKTVTPVQRPSRHRQLLQEWWGKYNKDASSLAETNDYPPVVREYLRTMLSYRLGLQRPVVKPPIWDKLFYTELGFQLDPTASLFDAQAKRFFEPLQFVQPAQYDLPPALGELIQDSRDRELPPDPSSLVPHSDIEPIAFHVPAHCFYIRFGSYSNFTWLQDTTALWGGDMRNLIALRALNTRSDERLEQQLGLRQDALAKLFGDAVIDDVAVIGTDLFFEEGASFGLLFRARNSVLLANDFNAKRRDLLRQNQSRRAVEKILDVQGQKVSAITSPDQHLRTFYVTMGEYHLVTRSEQLVRDFVALHVPPTDSQTPKPLSLGELPEFQQVREIMSVEDKATIFLYFSRPYFYNIVSPGYWIETQRRTTAASDIELLRLGGMTAAAEGHGSHADVDRWLQLLRTGGYIPRNFGPLPDGSDTILASWKDIRNSLRGERGSFVPVADMLPTHVTEAEYHAYEAMCRDFFENWGNLDPVIVSIKRTPGTSREGKTEHITIDARMAPLSRKNGETLQSQIGPPLEYQMAPVPGNFASFEISLAGNHFFGALRNEAPPREPGEQMRPIEQLASDIVSGIVLKDKQMLIGDLLAGYLGYVGQPGTLLKTWNVAFLQRDDASGYSRGVGGTWRRHFGQYTLYSRQRGVLDQVSPQLGFVPADYAAQLRVNIGNPLTAHIAPTLNRLGYLRTCDTSRGNLRLLNDLQTQFLINGPECKDVAEQLLGGELICPLGGQYVYQPYGDPAFGMGRWHATALGTTPSGNRQNASPQPPAGFLAPPLNWFRGGKFDALLSPDAVSIQAEFDMLLPERGVSYSSRERK